MCYLKATSYDPIREFNEDAKKSTNVVEPEINAEFQSEIW